MPFKIDLHTHSFFSGDGVSSPEENIASAKAKGLHGFALTDHNTNDGVTYLLEKGLMREDGMPVDDFLIIPGVEVTTAEGHLLSIGASLPYLKGRPAREVCDLIHENGGLAIPPHPYDLFRAGIRFSTLEKLPIDALEVFNAATTLRRYNRLCLQICPDPRAADDGGERCPPSRGHWDRLHDSEHRRFLGPRDSRPDPEKQRAEPGVSHPQRQRAQNLEQLDAPAPAQDAAEAGGPTPTV